MRAPAQPRARRERPKNAPVTRTRTRTRRERSRPGSSRRPDASSATRTGEVVARHAAAHGAEIRALTGCLLRPHTAHAHAHAHATMHMLSSEACHAEVEAIPAKAQPHPAVSRRQAAAWQPCIVTSHPQPAAGEEIFYRLAQKAENLAKRRSRASTWRRTNEPHGAADNGRARGNQVTACVECGGAVRAPTGSACANGEQGTLSRKRSEGDCERGRQQKCTLFRRTIVGLIEPERLVKVRKAGAIGSTRGGRRRAPPAALGDQRGPNRQPGVPVEKKRDLY
jgi:hypothetical protein